MNNTERVDNWFENLPDEDKLLVTAEIADFLIAKYAIPEVVEIPVDEDEE